MSRGYGPSSNFNTKPSAMHKQTNANTSFFMILVACVLLGTFGLLEAFIHSRAADAVIIELKAAPPAHNADV